MSQPTPDDTLFDPAPYTKGTPRQPREPRPVPAAVRVAERGWYAIARNGHPPLPLAHRVTYANPLALVGGAE